jgi:hypothetical protein
MVIEHPSHKCERAFPYHDPGVPHLNGSAAKIEKFWSVSAIRWISGPGTSLVVPVAGMRKRHRVLILAMLVAALIVPFGFARSLETRPASTSYTVVSNATVLAPLPDGLRLTIVGTALFGLASAVRRRPKK